MIRAVLFDAVGTLIHPVPSAAQIYAEVGAQHGSRVPLDEIRRRFGEACARQEQIDRAADWRTSEEREQQRWRSIVAEVLDDVTDSEACFQALYQHFATPSAWLCAPGTAEVLEELRRRGCAVGLASNYDARLRTVLAGLPELGAIDHVFISSELGWRKPGRAFFTTIGARLDLPPGQMLMVGDDPENDLAGAEAAGLQAVLFEQGSSTMPEAGCVRRLDEVLALL